MRTEISQDSEAYELIMFIIGYTTAGYKIISVSQGKPPLFHPLANSSGRCKLSGPHHPALEMAFTSWMHQAWTLTHSLLIQVSCLTWPAANTMFKQDFDNLHPATSQGCGLQGTKMCRSSVTSTGDNRDPRCPSQAQDSQVVLGAWQGGQS